MTGGFKFWVWRLDERKHGKWMVYYVKSRGANDISEWCLCAGIGKSKQEGKSIRKSSENLVTTVGSRGDTSIWGRNGVANENGGKEMNGQNYIRTEKTGQGDNNYKKI
jgi:hypothetical protein